MVSAETGVGGEEEVVEMREVRAEGEGGGIVVGIFRECGL